MTKPLTVQQFFKQFPDDATCLEHLMLTRFGSTTLICAKCQREGRFLRLVKLPAYSCPHCGDHIHPMVGTPFERSSTALQKWFYAMYLFTTSRHGVPAKELQRQLGVTYKTAWRMGHEIRKYIGMVDGDRPLSGQVEVDEIYVGGKQPQKRQRKTAVLGIIQRGGDIVTQSLGKARLAAINPIMDATIIKEGTTVNTDESRFYKNLDKRGYQHKSVMHSLGNYVSGTCHTNTLEGFWSQLKRSIPGTHVHVSGKHMQKYLNEFEYRYNMRKVPHMIFPRLMAAF